MRNGQPREKIRSRMPCVMVVIPDEVLHDEFYLSLYDLLLGADLRFGYSWGELKDETADFFQDVIVFFPKPTETAQSIRRQMTDMHLACPEADGLLVTRTDMSQFKDPVHDETILTGATPERLAEAIKSIFAARAAKQPKPL